MDTLEKCSKGNTIRMRTFRCISWWIRTSRKGFMRRGLDRDAMYRKHGKGT